MKKNSTLKNSILKYKGVIFDLDGTLLDSLSGIANAMNGLLEQMGYPPHPQDSYRKFVGDGIKMLIKRAMPTEWYDSFPNNELRENIIDGEITGLVKEFRDFYAVTWPRDTKPFDGIKELLNDLTETGIKMAVLSNKADDLTKPMVMEFLPDQHFEMVLGGRPGIPRKPDPTAVTEIIDTLELLQDEIIFIGDSDIDMRTAVNANLTAVGVSWGLRDREELLENGAVFMLDTPSELWNIIKG